MVCAILLSYKRQENIDRIVRDLLESKLIDKIIVSNNNPEINIHEWVHIDSPKLELINQSSRQHCIKRFEIAAELPYEYFYCPDDDLFLTPAQTDQLLMQLMKYPHIPHGMYGQTRNFYLQDIFLGSDVFNINCEVDVLNRCYAFTKKHVDKMFELIKALGYSAASEAKFMDDILLSFSGEGLPLCHDLGPFEECPTSGEAGIATWTENGFHDVRIDGYVQLLEIVGDHTRRPRMKIPAL